MRFRCRLTRLAATRRRLQRSSAARAIEVTTAARTHQRIAQGAATLRHADARYRPAAAERIRAMPTTHKPRIGGAWRSIIEQASGKFNLTLVSVSFRSSLTGYRPCASVSSFPTARTRNPLTNSTSSPDSIHSLGTGLFALSLNTPTPCLRSRS